MTFITDFKAFSTVMRMKSQLNFDEIAVTVMTNAFNCGSTSYVGISAGVSNVRIVGPSSHDCHTFELHCAAIRFSFSNAVRRHKRATFFLS
jgi:hypothetical protein